MHTTEEVRAKLAQEQVELMEMYEKQCQRYIQSYKILKDIPDVNIHVSLFYFCMTFHLPQYDGKYVWTTIEHITDLLNTSLDHVSETRMAESVQFHFWAGGDSYEVVFAFANACVPIKVKKTHTIEETIGYSCPGEQS